MYNHVHTNQPVSVGDTAKITSSKTNTSMVRESNAQSIVLLSEFETDFLKDERKRFSGSTHQEYINRLEIWIKGKRDKLLLSPLAPAHSNLMATGPATTNRSVFRRDFRRDQSPSLAPDQSPFRKSPSHPSRSFTPTYSATLDSDDTKTIGIGYFGELCHFNSDKSHGDAEVGDGPVVSWRGEKTRTRGVGIAPYAIASTSPVRESVSESVST